MSENVPEAIFVCVFYSFFVFVQCSWRYTIKTKINFVFHNFLFLYLHYFLLFTCKVIAIPLNLCANKIQMSTATPHKSPPIFFLFLNENNSYVHQIDFQIKTLFLLNKTYFPLYKLCCDVFFSCFRLFFVLFSFRTDIYKQNLFRRFSFLRFIFIFFKKKICGVGFKRQGITGRNIYFCFLFVNLIWD